MSMSSAALDHEQQTVLGLLAYFYLQHAKADKALPLLLTLSELYPHRAEYAKALSYAYLKLGHAAEALAAAERFLGLTAQQHAPEHVAALLLRSKALWALDRHDEARQCLNQYIEARAAD